MDATTSYSIENFDEIQALFGEPEVTSWNVPLMENGEIMERPAEQTTITRRYTQRAVDFIDRNRAGPFLLYVPHSMPHTPLFRSEAFAGKSEAGRYGDVIEEIDWSVVTRDFHHPATGDWVHILHATLRRKARCEAAGDASTPISTSDLREEVARFKQANSRLSMPKPGTYV